MSDMRFVLLGAALVFAGFGVLGVFGDGYGAATLERDEFGTCYEYSEDGPPREVHCSYRVLDQAVFFGAVLAMVAGGVVSLVRGARGDWDARTMPGDARR